MATAAALLLLVMVMELRACAAASKAKNNAADKASTSRLAIGVGRGRALNSGGGEQRQLAVQAGQRVERNLPDHQRRGMNTPCQIAADAGRQHRGRPARIDANE